MHGMQHNVDLTKYNTFAFKAVAERFVRIAAIEQVPLVCEYCRENGLPLLLLGGGSNLVLGERLPGVVAQIALTGWRAVQGADGKVDIAVGAGELWQDIVERAMCAGYYGLENMALIPGTVGAAPVQNIGAYGAELKDHVSCVEVYDRETCRFGRLTNAECAFGYRDSIFKSKCPDRYIITAVHFALATTPQVHIAYAALQQKCEHLAGEGDITPHIVYEAVCQLRQQKLPDPEVLGSAGSFFKNPVISATQYEQLKSEFPNLSAYPDAHGYKLAAGWLIEQCGWKGRRQENVGVYEKQALVLVNYGGGDRSQIVRLAGAIQESVYNRFGVRLEPEPRFYPR